jgi:Recombination endonuclease VII
MTARQDERARRAAASKRRHAAYILATYGITGEQYDALLEAQGGRCAICGNRPRKQRLAVDHDHATGEVRGLLCKRCNHNLLGAAHENTAILQRAIDYLQNPPARSVLI